MRNPWLALVLPPAHSQSSSCNSQNFSAGVTLSFMAVVGCFAERSMQDILSSPLGTSTVRRRHQDGPFAPRWGSSTTRRSALTTSWGSVEWRAGLPRGPEEVCIYYETLGYRSWVVGRDMAQDAET